MVRSLGAGFAAKNAAESDDVFIWLLEVTLTDPMLGDTVLRFARATENVVVGGDTYSPFPFTVGEHTEDLTGELRELTVGILDMTGEVTEFLKTNDVDGAKVVMSVAFYDGSTYAISTSDTFSVVGYATNYERITLQLGGRNYIEAPFPNRPLDRHRCGFEYRGTLCGYVNDDDGSIRETCDFSLNGPNGCKAHNNEIRFGGFPSLPTRREDSK
jgi:phage-related protein